MTLSMSPTLAEVRRAVAIRLNFGSQADNPEMRDLVVQYVQSAAAELLTRHTWIENLISLEAPLIDGQTLYDFPDNIDPGRIERIIVLDVDGNELPLEADIQPHERSLYLADPDLKDLPLRYRFIDQQIEILPRPDVTNYPTWIIEGYQRQGKPVEDGDTIPVDEEALIRFATAKLKAHLNQRDAGAAQRDAELYLETIRPLQSEPSNIQVGGNFNRKYPFYQPRRTFRRR